LERGALGSHGVLFRCGEGNVECFGVWMS